MVNPKSKKKVNAQHKSASKNLKELTSGASKRLSEHYGSKYGMNTKKAGKRIGVKKSKK